MSVLGQDWLCYGTCGFVMASNSGIFYGSGTYGATSDQPQQEIHELGLPVMDHNGPSKPLNYGKPVQGQHPGTTGGELCHSGDTCHLVVRDGNNSNSSIQNN